MGRVIALQPWYDISYRFQFNEEQFQQILLLLGRVFPQQILPPRERGSQY